MKKKRKIILISLAIVVFIIGWTAILLVLPPSDFPLEKTVKIEAGLNLDEIATKLTSERLIRSERVFKFLVYLGGTARVIPAGDYFFPKKASAFSVAKRFGNGIFNLNLAKITIPEGATAKEIGVLIKRKIKEFDIENFNLLATPLEGYLFPDTYFFSPKITPAEAVEYLHSNFKNQTASALEAVKKSGRTLEEIITMAALLEEEAKTTDSRRIISGILWKRIDDDMLLQVDAVFPYIINKNTFEVTRKDLQTDSPYNTYKYKGLPAGPITNPGLDAILAAAEPLESPYWFYLSDHSGRMHYAIDYDQHKKNKAQYLN